MSEAGKPPTLRVSGGLALALSGETLRSIGSGDLARFLGASRWFGGKGREPSAVRIAEVIPVEWDGDRAAVARVTVAGADGLEASYQLPLVVREAEMSGPHAPPAHAVLAVVDAQGIRGLLFDALHDPRFRARLAIALERGASYEGDGARWTLEPVVEEAESLEVLASRVVSGEQSNSSVVYGDRAILKLFRKLEPGINPDVEITRFLTTHTSFRHTPELLAALRYDSAPAAGASASDGASASASGGTARAGCVAGMLSRFVPHAVDGWRYALGDIRSYLGAHGNGAEPSNTFVAEARLLGEITAELHAALASGDSEPAFAPEPVTAGDIVRWADGARRTIDSALDLLAARIPALDARTGAMSRAIAARRATIHELLDEAARGVRGERASEQGIKSRTHGDYHLGQLLRAPDGRWFVIDFEGEPARPLAERRELTSPARDVAGMLRSFAYAAAAGASEAGGLGTNPATEIRAAHWERDTSAAFLAAYGAEADDPLIELFVMEKMFYELEYELNNRPDWVWVPLRAIARLF